MSLTVKQIESAKFASGPERLSDGHGLYLRLFSGGRKSFVFRTPPGAGAVTWITLGSYPEMGLKDAREKANIIRGLFADGKTVADVRELLSGKEQPLPSSSRRKRRSQPAGMTGKAGAPKPATPTFQEMARTWFEMKKPGLRNAKHVTQNWNTIATYMFPDIGSKPIDEIKLPEIVDTIAPIWRLKHETARRTLGRTREIFALAKIRGYRDDNPADFDPKIALGAVRTVRRHHGSLPPERVPEFWDWLQTVPCEPTLRYATMLLLLTAKRSKETRHAEWDFFNFDTGVWTTPERLMKMHRSHRVPMSRQAIRAVIEMRPLSGHEKLVFAKPRNRSGALCENAIRNLAIRFEPGITAHGFRASFRTWARQQKRFTRDTMEFALAHEPDDLEAAYQREDLLEERVELMQDWADYVTGGRDPIGLFSGTIQS